MHQKVVSFTNKSSSKSEKIPTYESYTFFDVMGDEDLIRKALVKPGVREQYSTNLFYLEEAEKKLDEYRKANPGKAIPDHLLSAVKLQISSLAVAIKRNHTVYMHEYGSSPQRTPSIRDAYVDYEDPNGGNTD